MHISCIIIVYLTESGTYMLKRNSHTPLYIQLADLLREQINTGVIKVGDKLPSEAEMIKEYKLGRLTVREALSILANEGLIEKHHGKGTFCKACITAPKHRIDILLDLANTYFVLPYYLRAFCDALEPEDVNIILSDTKNDDEKICASIEKALADGSDGVILQPSTISGNISPKLQSLLETLRTNNTPYILIDGFFMINTYQENAKHSYAAVDDIRIGSLAAKYFESLGHKHLCMIELDEYHCPHSRKAGFFSATEKEPYSIVFNEFSDTAESLKESLAEMFEKNPDITGIFCYNDAVARVCYEALAQLGRTVGDDISVIGVDDTIIASALSPTLTTVVHPKDLLAKETAEAMLSLISGKKSWPFQKIYEPSLSIRKSCKPL